MYYMSFETLLPHRRERGRHVSPHTMSQPLCIVCPPLHYIVAPAVAPSHPDVCLQGYLDVFVEHSYSWHGVMAGRLVRLMGFVDLRFLEGTFYRKINIYFGYSEGNAADKLLK